MQKLYHVDNDTYAEPNSMESDECEWTRFVVHCLCITDIFLVEYIQLYYNYFLHFLFLVCFCKDCIQRCSFSSLHLPCCAKRCWNRSVRRLFNHVHVSYTMVNHKKIFSWQKLVHLAFLASLHVFTDIRFKTPTGRKQPNGFFKHDWDLNSQQSRNKSNQWTHVSCIHIGSSYRS